MAEMYERTDAVLHQNTPTKMETREEKTVVTRKTDEPGGI
jgi:hypothetical protein